MGFISFILQQSSSKSQPAAQQAPEAEAPADALPKAEWQKPNVSPIQVAKPAPKIKSTKKKGK